MQNPHESSSHGPRVLLSLTRAGEQSLAGAGQSDHFDVRVVAPVLGAAAFDGNDVTRAHRIPRPAGPQKSVRTAHFKAPIRHLAIVVFDVNVKPGVRIQPLEFRDRARQLDRFLAVVFRRKRMMCEGWPCAQEQPETSNDNRYSSSHRSTSLHQKRVTIYFSNKSLAHYW